MLQWSFQERVHPLDHLDHAILAWDSLYLMFSTTNSNNRINSSKPQQFSWCNVLYVQSYRNYDVRSRNFLRVSTHQDLALIHARIFIYFFENVKFYPFTHCIVTLFSLCDITVCLTINNSIKKKKEH